MSHDQQSGANGAPGPPDDTHYQAFLSYSHHDSDHADWLHKAIERFAVPKGLVGRVTANGAVPRSLSPIFRDRHELAASSDLGQTIRAALKQSRFLIVLCSPAAAASRWVNEEILTFKKLHGERCVLAAIVGGEPWASEMAGREAEECFPPALRERYDRRGRATGKRAEPIAADLRQERDGREAGKLKLIAGMLGLGLDDLVRRDQQRRQKRLTYIAAAALAGMTMASGLAVFAFDKRDEARDQRREAEGLVGFMLGDLKEVLEPIGKLDALNAVGTRALAYFEKQDKAQLSDAALAQRSQALSLLGGIAYDTGDLDGASARYREAMTGTAEMVRRAPDDPQRLFDHAQNLFWIGDLANQRGQPKVTEQAWREYKRLADRMVAIDPTNPKWQLEIQSAAVNLGVVLYGERDYAEATTYLRQALSAMENPATANVATRQNRQSVAETLAWLADSLMAQGELDEAIIVRTRQLKILESMIASGDRDVALRQQAIPAHQSLATLFVARRKFGPALIHARAATAMSADLIEIEPKNAQWRDVAVGARLTEASAWIASGKQVEADAVTRSACADAKRLIALDPGVTIWRERNRDCLLTRTRAALTFGRNLEALGLAREALLVARGVKGKDPIEDSHFRARAERMLGDAQRRLGDREESLVSWQRGIDLLAGQAGVRPWEIKERAMLLQRLGRDREAKPLVSRLSSIGYDSIN